MPKRKSTGRPRLDRVVIDAELRDPIDWDRFAWALFQYARIRVEQEEAQKDSSP